MKIAKYLGNHVSSLLAEAPFKNWPFERSFNDDLQERIIHYLFREHGLELRCNKNDNVSVIFLYSDKYNGFDETLLEIPFCSKRRQVVELFGTPAKSGGKVRRSNSW